MSNSARQTSVLSGLGSMVWPIMAGLWATGIFYVLVLRGPLAHPLMARYFAAHFVSFAATSLFFVGISALLFKLIGLFRQAAAITEVSATELLEEDVPTSTPATEVANKMLDVLGGMPSKLRKSFLGQRITAALEHVVAAQTADDLDEQMRHLSDRDADKQVQSYSLVKLIVWATPMLGFLGTVIGITAALGSINAESMADSDTMINSLASGLFVAFDTTTVAIALSLVLMFCQFLVDRLETQLWQRVDDEADKMLAGQFHRKSSATPQLAAVERMAEAVMTHTQEIVQRQAKLWQATIDAAHHQWNDLTGSASQTIQNSLAEALKTSLEEHAASLANVEKAAAERLQSRWEQWQQLLSENARRMDAQQQEFARQGDLMLRAIEATGEVTSLQEALNKNLSTLSGSQHFEETVVSLAAAIQLLSARLGAADNRLTQRSSDTVANRKEAA